MNTEELKEIKTRLALIEAEMGRVRVAVREATEQPDSSNLEQYAHLLPEGYEFCKEGEHETWVKVKDATQTNPIGHIWKSHLEPDFPIKNRYRPIRKTPTPTYEVDWTNSPDWADVHAFDGDDGMGCWFGVTTINECWDTMCSQSHFTLPDGLDWKSSKTFRPR